MLFGAFGIVNNIVPRHVDATATGGQHATNDLHGSGLSRTVGAKKAQHFATGNGKADVVNSTVISVITCDVIDID